MSDNISFNLPENRLSSGIGYIVIPDTREISRDKYIIDCYKNSWVSIFIEGEGVKSRVHCDTNTFNWIYFPKKNTDLGTPIVWVSDPLKGVVYVIATLPGSSNLEQSTENEFRFIRRLDKNFVEISGNPEKKYLNLVVHSDDSSKLNINVSDTNKNSQLNISVNGDLLARVNKNIKFISHNSFEVVVENEEERQFRSDFSVQEESIREATGNRTFNIWNRFFLKVSTKTQSLRKRTSVIDIVPEKISMKTDRFEINTGKEKMILGDSLVLFLEEFIKEVSEIQIATPMGLIPLYNKRRVAAFTLKLKKLLSRHGYLS